MKWIGLINIIHYFIFGSESLKNKLESDKNFNLFQEYLKKQREEQFQLALKNEKIKLNK